MNGMKASETLVQYDEDEADLPASLRGLKMSEPLVQLRKTKIEQTLEEAEAQERRDVAFTGLIRQHEENEALPYEKHNFMLKYALQNAILALLPMVSATVKEPYAFCECGKIGRRGRTNFCRPVT